MFPEKSIFTIVDVKFKRIFGFFRGPHQARSKYY